MEDGPRYKISFSYGYCVMAPQMLIQLSVIPTTWRERLAGWWGVAEKIFLFAMMIFCFEISLVSLLYVANKLGS